MTKYVNLKLEAVKAFEHKGNYFIECKYSFPDKTGKRTLKLPVSKEDYDNLSSDILKYHPVNSGKRVVFIGPLEVVVEDKPLK